MCVLTIIIKYLHEPEEGRETLNLVALGESVVLGGINLSHVHGWVLLFKDGSCSSIFRGELLAVTAKIV